MNVRIILSMTAILITGFTLRIANLLSDKSCWGDEFFSMYVANKPMAEVISGAIQDVHPPLYYMALHFFSYNELTMRAFSLLSGVGLIWAIYLLGKEIFNRNVGFVAAGLVAVSPYFLQSSNEIRSYSFLAFLVTLATYFHFRGNKIPYIILAVMAVFTEHFSWFWIGSLILISLIFKTDRKTQLIVFLLCLPSLFLIGYQSYLEGLFNASKLIEYQTIPLMIKKVVGILWHFSCGYRYSMMNFNQLLAHAMTPIFYLHILFTVLIFWLCFKGIKKVLPNSMIVILFFWWVIMPIVFLAVFYPIRLDARYLSFCAPAFYLLVAKGLTKEDE